MNNCFQGLGYNFQSIRILTLAILFNFYGVSISTKKKSKWGETWRNTINQKALTITCPGAMKVWKPSKNERLFSGHFIDGIPATRNQNRTEILNEDAIKKLCFCHLSV